MKGVEEGSNKTFLWTRKDENWSNNDVYKRLNGTSANGNPVFINNTRYNYMVDGNDWYSKIENHNWKYGRLMIEQTNSNGINVYETENAWNDYIPAKIGLMYLHDYYLAYDSNRNWKTNYDASSWIHFVNNKNTTGANLEWILPDYNVDSIPCAKTDFENALCTGALCGQKVCMSIDAGMCWQPDDFFYSETDCDLLISWVIGSVGMRDMPESYKTTGTLRPTFYLSSTVTIKSGIGSITDPYIIQK